MITNLIKINVVLPGSPSSMTEAELAAVRNPRGAVSAGDTLASLPARGGGGALAGSLSPVDCCPLAPAPLGALVASHTVRGCLARAASLHPVEEEGQEMI